jgi:hypothetical protein
MLPAGSAQVKVAPFSAAVAGATTVTSIAPTPPWRNGTIAFPVFVIRFQLQRVIMSAIEFEGSFLNIAPAQKTHVRLIFNLHGIAARRTDKAYDNAFATVKVESRFEPLECHDTPNERVTKLSHLALACFGI